MKILVTSDSHGNSTLLYKAAEKENPDMFIHLGDIEDDADEVAKRIGAPKIPCVFIKGNCDSYYSRGNLQSSAVFSLKGHRFYCTHGHIQSVNYGLDKLVFYALDEDCDIALYGHTHIPFNEFIEGSFGAGKVHVMNPGSIALPRGGSSRSYMVIDLKDSGAYNVELKTL